MKKLLIAIAIFCASATYATAQQLPEPATLLADETWIFHMNSGKIKVETYNEEIANKIIKAYMPCECLNYSFNFKKAKGGGKEAHWSIYLAGEEEAKLIAAFAANKPKTAKK